MVLKGGRLASQSPHHNSSAPGIRADSVELQQFCSHCQGLVAEDEKVLQITRRSREHKSATLHFCINCWELIAGVEFVPEEVPEVKGPYYCSICEDPVHAGDSSVVIVKKGVGKYPPTFGAIIFHDECFLEETGDHFWD